MTRRGKPRGPGRQAVEGGLVRRLGTVDAVVLGLGSMLGAGVFAAFAPAARAAGAGLLIGLALAAVVAYCNAMSSAALAARWPESGGTYVYGRRQLGDVWGFLAGWGFVIGKTASCAAMALTFATYAAPGYEPAAAAAAVVALAAVNYVGITKTAGLARVLLAVTLLALGAVVIGAATSGRADAGHLAELAVPDGGGWYGVLQAAGLLFFAFAGYARIATLGEEVRDPARTIPRAIPLALGVVVVLYGVVGVVALSVLGAAGLGAASAPLAAVATAGGADWLGVVARVGAAVAGLGALLAMIAGVARTTLAMSRNHDLPGVFARIHPRYRVPHRAELALAAVVIVLVVTVDLRGAIGFSSFAVLVYYAIANAAALRLPAGQRRFRRWLPVFGLFGCLVLAASLPLSAVFGGLGLFAVGLLVWLLRTRLTEHHPGRPGTRGRRRGRA